jgi:CheY-like chemotaxis protein
MHGRRVIVADDDPAITWFFADLLRAQGCDVDEAADGAVALDRARRTMPDLVVSDIRMPRLDGLRLCRTLRADPLLADVPVLLLSWKEDWLHEAERGGVEASAYLAKRSTPEEVLARVLEVLAPHARFERRLRQPGPVRGALDGASPSRLLRLACSTHADSRLTLRCETQAYEIQIRGSSPRSAVCVPVEGPVARATNALGLLLAERAGRFTLTPDGSDVDDDLLGTLHQQIASHVARARRGLVALAPVEVPALAPVVAPAPPTAAEVAPPAPFVYPQVAFVSAPRVLEPANRTTPMVLQRGPALRPVAERTAPLRPTAMPVVALAGRRSWNIPLRWLGVAAVAALGIVLGAGARVLKHTPETVVPVQAQAQAQAR